MPLPVNDADKVSLDQLATADREVKTDDLFKRKRMKGWWPSYEVDDEGTRLLNVSPSCVCAPFQFHIPFSCFFTLPSAPTPCSIP